MKIEYSNFRQNKAAKPQQHPDHHQHEAARREEQITAWAKRITETFRDRWPDSGRTSAAHHLSQEMKMALVRGVAFDLLLAQDDDIDRHVLSNIEIAVQRIEARSFPEVCGG